MSTPAGTPQEDSYEFHVRIPKRKHPRLNWRIKNCHDRQNKSKIEWLESAIIEKLERDERK